MKFLCVSCNTQMKLIKDRPAVTPDSHGSLSIRYECPECLAEIAMLTNAFETQLVTSLGVEIGGETVSNPSAGEGASKCPFSNEARKTLADTGLDISGIGEKIGWSAQALVRLQNIPEFVRPMAKQGIEKFALDQGFEQVTEQCMDEAREEFGM